MTPLLTRFLATRAAVVGFVAAIAGFFISGQKVAVPLGILIGVCVSVYKTRLFGIFLASLVETDKANVKAGIFQAFSQLLVFGLLLAAVIAETLFFLGMAAGLLIVPAVIAVNAVTEGLGLTRNAWGGAAESEEAFGKGN